MERTDQDQVQGQEQEQEKGQNQVQEQEKAEEQEQGVYILYGILYNNGSDPTIASNITDQKVETTSYIPSVIALLRWLRS